MTNKQIDNRVKVRSRSEIIEEIIRALEDADWDILYAIRGLLGLHR